MNQPTDQTIESPCIAVCQLDDNEEYCIGCYRTPEEIENWSQLSEFEKNQVLQAIQARKETQE